VPGLQVRWRGLRRRGVFPDPPRDLPQWEAQILDAIGSLAIASAERWVMAGPVSGSSSAAIQTAIGPMQPGWLLKVAPTGLAVDLPLPDLGREGTGRMIAVQHNGAARSALRLGWGGSAVAACMAPGQIAMCVWDGTAWAALTGRVEWVDVHSSPEMVESPNATAPLVVQAIANYGQKFWCFPTGSNTGIMRPFMVPQGWIRTDIQPCLMVVPLVNQAANANFTLYWLWEGVGEAPAVRNYANTPPGMSQQTVNLGVTATNYSRVTRVPFSNISVSGLDALFTTADAALILSVDRNGATDGYTTAYSGTSNNVALWQLMFRCQVCSHGVTTVS
jgi:hypothetical protein